MTFRVYSLGLSARGMVVPREEIFQATYVQSAITAGPHSIVSPQAYNTVAQRPSMVQSANRYTPDVLSCKFFSPLLSDMQRQGLGWWPRSSIGPLYGGGHQIKKNIKRQLQVGRWEAFNHGVSARRLLFEVFPFTEKVKMIPYSTSPRTTVITHRTHG